MGRYFELFSSVDDSFLNANEVILQSAINWWFYRVEFDGLSSFVVFKDINLIVILKCNLKN